MEVRGQDKDMGLPLGGFSTNTIPASSAQPNQEPSNSNKLSSSASLVPTVRRTTNVVNPTQTLDHHHLHQQEQQNRLVLGIRDSNPNPNPDPDPPSPTTIGGASNSKITSQPQPQPTNGSSSTIRYRECLKNHAAAMGGHAVDGCGEFMPGGEEGTSGALKCAACDCHRNFHRKEVDGESQSGANSYLYPYNPSRNHRITTTHHLGQVPPPLPPPPQHHHHRYSHGPIPPMLMAFGGSSGAPAESSSEDLNMFHFNAGTQPAAAQPPFSGSKKRYRTKFSQEQKERMQELAERLGWKIQKQDEEEVQQFCAEVGVKRKVLKVWMHNSKQAMKKKQL